jgi:hypothetical protein
MVRLTGVTNIRSRSRIAGPASWFRDLLPSARGSIGKLRGAGVVEAPLESRGPDMKKADATIVASA